MKHKKRARRRIISLSALILIAAWLVWSNVTFGTTHYAIADEKIPASFAGFTIAQVSDLHNAKYGDGQAKLLAAVRQAEPDIIAVTGDLIDAKHTDVEAAMEFIRGAVDIAPVYFVTGNHEAWTAQYETLQEQMTKSGVIILDDTAVTLTRGGDSLRLLGLRDPAFTESTDDVADKLTALLGDGGEYSILLSHRPALMDVYAESGVNLVLSGHVHGGQIRIPFLGGLVRPSYQFFPDYTGGLYEQDGTQMVVSRGLGNSVLPVRVNNRPELVVITLEG